MPQQSEASRPRWLRSILATNRRVVERFRAYRDLERVYRGGREVIILYGVFQC